MNIKFDINKNIIPISSNVILHNATVSRKRRAQLNQHKSVLLWFTGLSGSGKSTLAHTVEEKLFQLNCRTFVLDGDNVRHGLCGDLNFSNEERSENIRRIGEVSKLFIESGTILLAAFISPFVKDRQFLKRKLGNDYIEIYCKCALDVCESRDVKGLYKKARNGEIADFTGISSPYEESNSDLVIETDTLSLNKSAEIVIDELLKRKFVMCN